MVSEVANSKYHSLFFILQTGEKRLKRSHLSRQIAVQKKGSSNRSTRCNRHLLPPPAPVLAPTTRYHKQKRHKSGVTATCAGGMSHSASLTVREHQEWDISVVRLFPRK